MAKFLKPGKVVVVLNGRYAGKKAVITDGWYPPDDAIFIHLFSLVRHCSSLYFIYVAILIVSLHFDDGEKSTNKKFGCALVVGIERCPLKVTKSMSVKKADRRSKMKPFTKIINYSHLMPTRYNFDVDFKGAVSVETVKEGGSKKKEARKEIKNVLGDKYKAGQNKWFFTKLRF